MAQTEENPLELRIDEALADYMQQCDSGSLRDREAFLNSYPDLRKELAELLSAADWIEQLAGPTMMDQPLGQAAKVESDPYVEDTLPHFDLRDFTPDSDTLDIAARRAKSHMDSTSLVLPCALGDYILERVLGRGGMGVVYYGRQSSLERPVAIKMIRSGALASEEEVQRFYAEARSAAQLHHPNIVTVYQCGELNGHRYFSMDYVDGMDLSQLIADGPLDARLAARYVRDVSRAIQYAHDRGILHRDLKPANILVDQRGTVRITDFGLAKLIGTESGLTATGAALGTPSYMSPEQATGNLHEQHHATDIYALGAILFTLVTGKPPFKAPTAMQTLMHVIHRPAPMARSINLNIDQDLETIIDVCLQKSPERRYVSASALADDLDRFLQGIPIQARPMSRVRRTWYWLLGVPIFGAVFDHRVAEPTNAHRWFQRGLISIALMMAAAWITVMIPSRIFSNYMPGRVVVAGGMSGGSYDKLALRICDSLGDQAQCEALTINTAGSRDNLELLTSGKVQLALLQYDALGGAANVAILAPLYYEAVHILVRKDSGIRQLADLQYKRVNVGLEKAGSREIAERVLEFAGLSLEQIMPIYSDWHALIQTPAKAGEAATVQGAVGDAQPDTLDEPRTDAVIIVSRRGSTDVQALLSSGQFQLLPLLGALDFALKEPAFRHFSLKASDYPDCGLPDEGIETVATPALLVGTLRTPAVLVRTVLDRLFSPESIQSNALFSAEDAAHWQGLGVWHPAAQEFFAPYWGINL